ncbi:MAG: hypothetical protein ABIS50_14380 [Luteolibacter sp.]|uniref:hypothetical protein n=1 Tax=Luteolibacter sp. TaxID=1962973 RepID=UPI0032650CE6
MKTTWITIGIASAALCGVAAAARLTERLESVHESFLENRREILPSLSDPFGVPAVAREVAEQPRGRFHSSEEWKRNVVATVFWVGELPTENNPTPNTQSAWDQNWQANFGGYDEPDRRSGYLPADFTPSLNPFYVALPYNDVAKGGVHRPEASQVIPWFWESYRGDGISVCKGRWLAIHHEGRVCFAQWEDVGPFEVDHWQYVFGKESPRSNRNQSAGIDLSPAVRDFLKLRSGETVEWRFAEDREVPRGPWKNWSREAALPQR